MDLIKKIILGVAVVIAVIALVIIGASLINSNMNKTEKKEVVILNEPGGDKEKNTENTDADSSKEQKDTEKEIQSKDEKSTLAGTEVADNKDQNTESSIDKNNDNNQNNNNISGNNDSVRNDNGSNSSGNNTNQNVSDNTNTNDDNSENINSEDPDNGESNVDTGDESNKDNTDREIKDKDENDKTNNNDKDKEVSTETKVYVDEEEEKRKKELETVNPLIYVDEVSATKGTQNIKVNVNVKNNPGILGMILTVYFDESAMQLKQVANGSAVSDVLNLTEANVLKSGCNFVWDGQELAESDIKDGSVLELEFEADESLSQGKYPIKIVCEKDDVIDSNLTPVELSIVNGSIKIE